MAGAAAAAGVAAGSVVVAAGSVVEVAAAEAAVGVADSVAAAHSCWGAPRRPRRLHRRL